MPRVLFAEWVAMPTGHSRTRCNDRRVDGAVAGALIGVGGVVLGVGLTGAVDHVARRNVSREQREQARHARELIAVEQLDQALIDASSSLDRESAKSLEERYADARDAWAKGWVAYSPRIRQREVLDRYQVVGSILNEVVLSDRTTEQVTRRIVVRAIANARSTLAHFMRGEDALPRASFPGLKELTRLLGEGDGLEDPIKPLKDWIASHPEADFHET